MVWIALYRISDGELESIAQVETPPVKAGYLALVLLDRPDLKQVMWDTTLRDFVPRPSKVVVDRLQDLLDNPAFADYQTWYNSLNATNKTRFRNLVIWALGKNRYRSESSSGESID